MTRARPHTGIRPSQPQRTCVACRTVRPRAELIRLVRGGDGLVSVDQDGVAAGRGAYACATAECLQKAFQPGRLGHAFKCASRAPRESVAVILEGWLKSRNRRR